MDDRSKRRSRTFWTEPLTKAGVGPGHTHEVTTRWKVVGVGVLVVVVAVTALVGWLFWLLILSDEHAEQDQQRIVCALLDSLPAGGALLEELRDEWDCGPGRPVSDFPPEVRDLMRPSPPPVRPVPVAPPTQRPERPGPSTEADRSRERPPLTGGAVAPETPPEATDPPQPPPAPTGPPLIDLGPVTDGLCEARIVCI